VPNAAGSSAAVRLVQQQQPHLGQSSSDSRLKKRGLDQDSGGGSGTDSAEMIVDVVSSGGPETQTQQQTAAVAESTNSKIARIVSSDSLLSSAISSPDAQIQNLGKHGLQLILGHPPTTDINPPPPQQNF
jgi:hypothetical protein